MLKLEFIHPNNLGKYWDIVKEGLGKVRSHGGDSWREEDVYMSCKNGQSTLHIGYVNDEYKGFIVLTPSQSFDGPILHIWATYSDARDFCVFTEGIEYIKNCAKQINAVRITFLSPRIGWEKYGVKLGFKPRTTQFAMEVI